MSKLVPVQIGADSIRGKFLCGKKEDFYMAVPPNTVHVSFSSHDNSSKNMNIGNGNGKATLEWSQGQTQCKVHAWVNGAVGKGNHLSWEVTAWVLSA